MSYYDELMGRAHSVRQGGNVQSSTKSTTQQSNKSTYEQLMEKATGRPYTSTLSTSYDPYQAVNDYISAYDKYLAGLDATAAKAKAAYDGALRTNKEASRVTLDPMYAGYATDEVSAANMNTNSTERVSKAELDKLYGEWDAAKKEAESARSTADYWKTMRKFNNNADAVIRDYDRRISEIENNPNAQKDPSMYGSGVAGVDALRAERDAFVQQNTQYQNQAEDYAALMAWQSGHDGSVKSYKGAQAAYLAADSEVKRLQEQQRNSEDPQIRASTGAEPLDLSAEIAAAIRKREQAKMIMDYAYQHRYDDLSRAEDYDLIADKGAEEFQAYQEELAEKREDYQQDQVGSAFGARDSINQYDPNYDVSYAAPTEKWTEEETKKFYYLWGSEKTDDAITFGAETNEKYLAEETADKDLATREFVTREFGTGAAASIATVPVNIVTGVADYIGMAQEQYYRGDIYETQYQGGSRWSDTVRGSIAQKLNEYGTIDSSVPVLGGKGWGDAYQLMMSMADSGVAVMGGGGLANLTFFGSAAASTTRQALERGLSADKAVSLGFAAGAAEVLGETLSVEHLLKQGDVADYLRNGLLKTMLKQGGIEGLEEVATTVFNTLADAWINGDQSELQAQIYANMVNGMSYDEAVRKAWISWASDLGADALGGFLSGGLMTGGRSVALSTASALTTYTGDTQSLFDIAGLTDEGSRSRKMAEQYQQRYEKKGSLSNLQAAKLEVTTLDELQAKDRPALQEQVKQRLEALEVENADKAAKAIVDRVLGEEKGVIGKTVDASIFKDSRVRNVYSELSDQLDGKKDSYSWLNDKDLMTVGQEAAVGRTLDKRLKLVKLKGSDQRVEIKKAEMKDGKLSFTYESDGKPQVVSADELDLDGFQRDAFDKLVELLGDDAAYAYNQLTARGLYSMDTYGIHEYATAFAFIRDLFGATGAKEEAALKSPIRASLTDEQVIQAYKLGQQKGQTMQADRPKSMRGTGKVTLYGGELDGVKLKAVSNQKYVRQSKYFRAVQAVAKALGIDVVMYESEADETGRLLGANGAYKDGVIYLDWNAGMNNINDTSERMLFRTMAHELTHFIQQNSKEDYAELKNYITKYLANTLGADLNQLVMEKEANQPGLSHEGAIDEVIADACETMLKDSAAVQELMRENKSLGGKIRRWVLSFLRKITPNAKEAEALQPVLAEVQAIWDRGLKNAVESREDVTKADVLESNSEALTEIPTEETATVTLPDGKQYSIRSMRHDIADGKMFEDLERYTDMSHEAVVSLRKNLEKLTDIIALNRNILDLNEPFGKDNRPFKPFKPNSDPLYTISLDFSTLCRKRLMTQYVIEKLQTELNDSETGKRGRPLTAEEQLAVRDLMKEYAKQEKALKVACAMCYVEAARLKAPGQIQRFMRDPTEPMRRYFALRNSEFNASILRAQADFKEQHGYARDAKKADMKPSDVKALNKLSDRLRNEYQMTAEEQKELDVAKTLPNETYLTAANLATLAEEHPVIYDAYTATIRSATRSKSLEADIPYYYGDSERAVKDKFIEAVNKENGMRFSSWSDFQIQHMLDMMTAVIELSVRHCAMHGYTKFLEQVRIFGKTGMMFNMSGVPNGTGLKADGSLDFSGTESVLVYGQNGEYDAIQARNEFPETAGLQCIGISHEHIQALLDSDIIDYIIPYHTSGLNATLRRMAQISNWKDFTAFQNAKVDERIKFDSKIHDKSTWHKEPVFSDFFNAAKQESNGYRAGEKGVVTMRRAAKLYKQMCRDRGLMPKFSWGNSKVDADFSNDPNYWKLLIDRKMINQKTGTLIEQKPVRPNFDFGLIERMVQNEVDAYDPTLQDRALNYVREHLNELPQRIADLKKAGAVKKIAGAKMNKATKALQAGPVAAVSEGNLKENAAQMSMRQTAAEKAESAEEFSDVNTQYSVRQSPPPKKTMIGYKVFMADKKHPGQLYPTKVKNPGGQGTPVGVWLDADTGEIARNPDGSIKVNTKGRISVKANGGSLAWRPGWHLGALPEANQMNRVDKDNPDGPGLMWDNYIFCECEFAADEDYQLEAFEYGTNEYGVYTHNQAGLPYIPRDGYYKYRTNPDPSTSPWYISGSIRITKILDDDMRREIIEKWNAEHPDEQMPFTERYSHKPINLTEYGFTAGPVTPTKDLSSVAPGVDYSEEIKNLPGYTRHSLNFDDPNVQQAFRIQQIEDRKDYYIERYNREHKAALEGSVREAPKKGKKNSAQLSARNNRDYFTTGDLEVDTNRAYTAATPLQDELNDIVRGISSMLGTKYEASTQKSKKSIKNKVIRKHGDGRSDYTVLDMKDHARSKVFVNEWSEIPLVLSYLRSQGIKYETEAVGPTPFGYRGFHVTWRNGDGLGTELQITMPHVWQVKLKSDSIYDKWRNVVDLSGVVSEYQADLSRSIAMWEALKLPDFKTWESSASDSILPFQTAWADTGDLGLTQFPSTYSNSLSEESSSSRPSSVSTNMGTPPYLNSSDSISQNRENGKEPYDNSLQYSVRSASDRELLLEAEDARLSDEERRVRAKYKAKVEAYRQRQQAVTTALDALDKAVEAGDAESANKQRAKVTAAEKKMAEALAVLTEAERGPELREILRREREIQRQRTGARIRDSYNRREMRQRIDKLWKDLNKRITSPTEKKNIPVSVMLQAVDALEAINMDTTKEGSERGETLRNKLNELRARYDALEKDPDYKQAAMYDPQVAEFLKNMVETVGDTPINRMSTEQLAAVYNTLRALDFTARKALKLKLGEQERNAYEIAKQMTQETRSVTGQKTRLLDSYINAGLSPARMFNRLGGYHKGNTWMQVYDMINSGQLRQTQLQVEGSLIFEDLLAAKEYGKFVDPKNTVDVGLKDADGNAIKITHGMLVSLYMHLLNEQNRRHIAYGGMTIPGLKDYYNGRKIKGTENASSAGGVLQEVAEINDRLKTEDDPDVIADLESRRDEAGIRAMTYLEELQKAVDNALTEYDRQWIAACRELFDGFSKRVLNETTMEVYGIKRANVENYFPIWVDGNFLNTPFETVAHDFSLENAGFMKERVDSSKPIRLADVSDVAASQIRKVAQYAGLMPVVRNFNKIWGKVETGYRDSVRQAVMQKFGDAGVKYIENLMADLNGARNTDNSSLGEMFNRLRGHMAQASLTLSLRTAAGQLASYPTAAAVLGWDAIHQGIANYKKVDPALILKWSPLLKYRMMGYRDPELGNIAEMNSKIDRIWKKARWATGWIQAADGFTVGQLVWSASEAYVQIHDKTLQKGTDAYYEAVAKKFNEAVELTQPNYTTMQRPDILRNPNALVKQLTMFLTQRLQNFNIMYDAAATYTQMKKDRSAGAYNVTPEDVRQAGIKTRTAFLSQIVAAGTIVAFKFLADALLHSMNAYRDDDDELTAESISMELLDMFLDSLAGNVIGGSEMYDLIESKVFGKTYYGIEVSGVSTITDALDAASKFYDKVAKGTVTAKDVDNLARKVSVIAGIPLNNAEKIIRGVMWHVQDVINGEPLSFEAGVDRTTTQQAHRLYRAYTSMDYGAVNKIREEVGDDDKLNQALVSYIKQQYADGNITKYEAQRQLVKYAGKDQKAAEKMIREYSAEVETGVKFSQIEEQYLLGDIDSAKAKQMLVKYGGLDAATAQMKVEFWQYQDKHAGTTLEFSEYKTYVSKYKSIGLSVEQYESYKVKLAACKGTDADGDGKADSGTKKAEVVALIDSMNLTAAQKDALYLANNYSQNTLKSTPWH